jgi:hypothetical protein
MLNIKTKSLLQNGKAFLLHHPPKEVEAKIVGFTMRRAQLQHKPFINKKTLP